jgi:hypothetical protein
MYSFLGWFNDNGLNNPIPIGSYVYTMNDLINLHPPLNVVGYQIPNILYRMSICSNPMYRNILKI